MKLFPAIATSFLLLAPLPGATSSMFLRKKKEKKEVTKTNLAISIHGLQGKHGTRDLNFMKDALITAYNQVHAKDDTMLLDFVSTSFATVPDTTELNLVPEDILHFGRKYDLGLWYGISDSACRLCGDDDDALALGKVDPWANLKAVEKQFCKLLDKSGEANLKHAHDCSISVVSVYEDVIDLGEKHEPKEITSTNLAISIHGLHGETTTPWVTTMKEANAYKDIVDLGKKHHEPKEITSTNLAISIHGLHGEPTTAWVTTMKEALLSAYNQVHRKDDVELLGFATTDFETVPDAELNSLLDDPDAELNSLLEDIYPVAYDLLHLGFGRKYDLGLWYGIGDSACRLCGDDDDALALGKVDPWVNVKAVEKKFCKLLEKSGEAGLKHARDCSISMVEFDLEAEA